MAISTSVAKRGGLRMRAVNYYPCHALLCSRNTCQSPWVKMLVPPISGCLAISRLCPSWCRWLPFWRLYSLYFAFWGPCSITRAIVNSYARLRSHHLNDGSVFDYASVNVAFQRTTEVDMTPYHMDERWFSSRLDSLSFHCVPMGIVEILKRDAIVTS